MNKQGLECRCIRCREIGHKSLKEKIEINEDDIGICCNYYEASGGEEIFISLVEQKNDALVGYLRLRNIMNSHRYELKKIRTGCCQWTYSKVHCFALAPQQG
jgi:elongator complex protein 3